MKRYWSHMVQSTEKRAEQFLKKQVRDQSRADFGRMDSDIIEGKQTIYMLTDLLCLYFCRDSKYYKDEYVFKAVSDGIDFVERWQRRDGSLDFPSCNFYSAPDTAFCFRRLFGAWKILRKYGETEAEKVLERRYFALMFRCAPILLSGGFHTPNHRWAVAAALLCLGRLSQDLPEELAQALSGERGQEVSAELSGECGQEVSAELSGERGQELAKELSERLHKRAEQYLAEGIDGDEDGEYAERSTGNYNAVVDKSLILAYEMTGNESLLGYVQRNLEMMLYYFDGDDTIFTANSTRQDQGKVMYPDQYFYLYTYMAEKTGSDLFDGAAHKIIKDNCERGDLAQDAMYIFMIYDRLRSYEFRIYGFLEEYRKFFRGSQVLRVKKKKYGYTVLTHKPGFLFLKFGSFPIGMRIGESYCDIRNFLPAKIEVTEGGCILSGEAKGWYYEPFDTPLDTSDWWKMDHTKRKQVVTSHLRTEVSIKEEENGLEITVKTEGLSGLPLRVEVDIPAGCVLENETFCQRAGQGESMILKSGSLGVRHEDGTIMIGPGYGTHRFQGHYSGEEKNEKGYSIFLNDYTPYERTFRIVEEG